MQVAGRTRLQDYPQCNSLKTLNQHIESWLHLFYEFGDGIGADHAKTMFVRTIPDSIRTEIYRRPDVERRELLSLVDWVRHQAVFERPEELIKAHLSHEQRVTAFEASDPNKGGQLAPFAPPPRQPGGALRPSPKRRPQPKVSRRDLVRSFKGCYHCGATDRSRTPSERSKLKGCPDFEQIRSARGGNIPHDLQGQA